LSSNDFVSSLINEPFEGVTFFSVKPAYGMKGFLSLVFGELPLEKRDYNFKGFVSLGVGFEIIGGGATFFTST
jgi:hypothetical protein